MQCYPRGSRQLCIRKNHVQCCLNTLRTILHRSKPYAILSERLQTTLHKKILRNFALILLGQHCTGKNPMQCCPRGSRQLCIKKFSVQCQGLMQSWSYVMLSQRLQAILHRKKFRQFRQCRLNNIYLVTLFIYVYIRSFTSKKIYKVMLSLL